MDHNQLDAILRKNGWFYDNGWPHDSTHWDCYVDKSYGNTDPFYVVLSNNGMGRILKISKHSLEKIEIWAGTIYSQQEVDVLLAVINSQPQTSE